MADVRIEREGRCILDVPAFEIKTGERWALLGPNGSGKSTLLSIISGRLWPTRGKVTLFGEQLGRVDLRTLRPRIGLMSATLTRELRAGLTAREAVVTGLDAALETWWRPYSDEEWARADAVMAELGISHLAQQALGVASEGERARILLARVLIASPELLCLDEPAAGLDLGAREELLGRLTAQFRTDTSTPAILVTHHLEELPVGLTHALLLRRGEVVALGELETVLTSEQVSAAFGIEVDVRHHHDGRISARAHTKTL